MTERQPWASAQQAAAYRLGVDRLPSPTGDPGGDDLLAQDVAAGLDLVRDERLAGYLRGRTRLFDRVVLNGLDRGNIQVASVGAGHDGRSLRYARPGVRWFEVDGPATLRDKQQRLARLGIAAPGVNFVAADVGRDDVAVALVRAGFEPDAPSLLLCESLGLHLEPLVLAGLLAQLRSLVTAGSRLALSLAVPGSATEVDELLTPARWRPAELSEQSKRAGLAIGVPVWAPGVPPTRAGVGAYLERTFHREGMDGLADHLAGTYDVEITRLRTLDVGVVRVERADGPSWVARVFPAQRPLDATRGDAETVRYLAEVDYPAERLAHPSAVSEHEGQAVLVTEFVDGRVPRATQAAFRQLGELLARLHRLSDPGPVQPGPPQRPGGGWHHLTLQGGPAEEFAALAELLATRDHVPSSWRPQLAALRREVDRLDDLHDLPPAFTHSDFVSANALLGPSGEPVIIDWAGAGVAPRLWTLAFLLWSAGAAGPRHVDAVVQGYRRHLQPEPVELARLEAAVAARPLIFDTWAYVTGRRALPEVAAGRAEVLAKAHNIAARARRAFQPPDLSC